MVSFIGWIIWGTLVFFAINWTFGIFYYLKTGKSVTKAIILQTASFWIIAVAFLLTGWNKLHLIWLVPLVYLIEMILSPSLFVGIPLKYSILGFLGSLRLSRSKNNGEIRDKIEELTVEINGENKMLASLLEKYRNNPDELSKLPEFTDPSIVVPQTCKRQFLIYLQTKVEGLSEKERLRAVLVSRYESSPANPTGLKSTDFEEFLNSSSVRLPDLCKEILNREQELEDKSFKKSLVQNLVDEYFAKEGF